MSIPNEEDDMSMLDIDDLNDEPTVVDFHQFAQAFTNHDDDLTDSESVHEAEHEPELNEGDDNASIATVETRATNGGKSHKRRRRRQRTKRRTKPKRQHRKTKKHHKKTRKRGGAPIGASGLCHDPNDSIYNTRMLQLFPYKSTL